MDGVSHITTRVAGIISGVWSIKMYSLPKSTGNGACIVVLRTQLKYTTQFRARHDSD